MSIASPKAVIKYLFASILVGTALGVSGAFAAQGFRSGIIFVSDFLKRIYQGEPNFFFLPVYTFYSAFVCALL